MSVDRAMLREQIGGLRTALKGGIQVVAVPSLYPTPARVADELIELADIEPGHRVLEPSAGTGSLLDAIKSAVPAATITAVELDRSLARLLGARDCARVVPGDFLALSAADLGTFDRIVMNPPFGKAADIKHIRHARTFLAPGGRLVAICAGGPRQRQAFGHDIVRELPGGTFSGTQVRSCVVSIDA